MTREYTATHDDMGPMVISYTEFENVCVRTPIGLSGEPENDRLMQLGVADMKGDRVFVSLDAEEAKELIDLLMPYVNGHWKN